MLSVTGNFVCYGINECSVLMRRPLKSRRNGIGNLVILVILILITIIIALRLRLAFLVEMVPRHVRLVPPNSRLEHALYSRMVGETLTLPFQGHSHPSSTTVSVLTSG